MPTQTFLNRCTDLAASVGVSLPSGDPDSDSDPMMGFFQLFRPDGAQLEGVFEGLSVGEQLEKRLRNVFAAAGNDRRPNGGRDAYFVVRQPDPIEPEVAKSHAADWLSGLAAIAGVVGEGAMVEALNDRPSIRVLEGAAPKHPKNEHEQSELMKLVTLQCPKLTSQIADVDPHAELLRSGFYFIACDPFLRDYLLWPFFETVTGLSDPLKGYFELWRHGVKFRIFGESQIDLYIPRV